MSSGRGWQRLPELYPLEVNTLGIRDGTPGLPGRRCAREPIRLTSIQGAAYNIRDTSSSGDSSHPLAGAPRCRGVRPVAPASDGAADFATAAPRCGARCDRCRRSRRSDRCCATIRCGSRVARWRAAGDVDLGDAGAHLAKVGIDDPHVDYLGGGDPREAEAVRQAAAAARPRPARPGGSAADRRVAPSAATSASSIAIAARPIDCSSTRRRSWRWASTTRDRDGRTSLRVRGRPMGSGRAWLRASSATGLTRRLRARPARRRHVAARPEPAVARACEPRRRGRPRHAVFAAGGTRRRIRGYVKPRWSRTRRSTIASRTPTTGLCTGCTRDRRRRAQRAGESQARHARHGRRPLGPVGDPQASTWQIIR